MSKSRKPPAGKSRSAAATAAREHARQLRVQQQKRDRRRRLLISVGGPVLVVVLVVAGFLIIKAKQKPAAATGPASVPAAATLGAGLQNIPAATFDSVGTGSGVHAPAAVKGAALTAAGKPRVLYIGAEFCPYCAGERWAVVAALSRFGTFSRLGTTTSSASDIYPNTATLSFHGATYTSSLLSFTGVEQTTNIPDAANTPPYTPLDRLTAADKQIDATYNEAGSIPFVDFGNKYVIAGASYDVSILQGMTHAQIAGDMTDPGTTVAQQVDGAANMMTAAICTMTANQPTAVCTSKSVTSQHLPG